MQKTSEIIRFIIITQLPEFREQLKEILLENDHYVVFEKDSSLQKSLLYPRNVHIDFAICGCKTVEMSTIELVKELKKTYENLNILVIAEDNALKHINSLCYAGADGFLGSHELGDLHTAIQTILSGKRYMNQIILNFLFQNMLVKGSATYDDHFAIFNQVEHQVFQLIGAGFSEDTIAEMLEISIDDVLLYKERLDNKTKSTHLCT